MDTNVNHRWRLSQVCSTSHQPSLTIDTSYRFPSSFRQRNLIFDDGGSIVPCNVTTIQHAVEQAHRLWFRLKRQLLGEFGALGMSPSSGLGSGSSILRRIRPDLPEIRATRLASLYHRLFHPSTGRAYSSRN